MGEDHEKCVEGQQRQMNPAEVGRNAMTGNGACFIDPVQGDKMLGAFRVACGIKGVAVIIHAPVGCHWGVNFIERLSSVKTNASISALRERSVVFGGEDSLKRTIEIILKNRKERYLILLAGSVPSIIGEDWQGVIDSLGFELHSIAMDCGGFLGRMGDGYEECLRAICQWIDDPATCRDHNTPTINLIGLQWDIVKGEANIKEIRRVLGLIGVRVNSVFPPSSLAEIKRASATDLNVVLGYGKRLAEAMEEKWGIPWISLQEYPYGLTGTEEFLIAVASALKGRVVRLEKIIERETQKVLKILKQAHLYLPALYGIPVAVSGDLPQASGMARFLSREIGVSIEAMHITSSPDSDHKTSLPWDICPEILVQDSWHKFQSLIERKKIAMLFGTDLENRISRARDIPLILYSYPTTSRIGLTSSPYMGFRGVPTLVEEMVNRVIRWT